MNLLFLKLRVLIKIISAIFRIYRRKLNLYQRFPNYIGATQFISAISHYIGATQFISAISHYIGATQFISAISQLYQRLFKYIDLPTKPDKRSRSNKYDGATSSFLCFYTRFQPIFLRYAPSSFHFTAR